MRAHSIIRPSASSLLARFMLSASMLVMASSLASAQDGAVALDPITVTTDLDVISDAATKTDDKLIDTLAGTSVVTKTEIDRFQPDSAGALLLSVPGVNFQESSDDPGSSINIRGLQDFGRVNVMIDGARQNFQRTGHNADGQFYLEPELVKKVDVVRGPVSTIYGSGAIGGIVNFETIDPADMLRHHEKWAASFKTSYSTNDDAILLSAIGAYKLNETVSVLGNFVWRDHDEYQDGNGNVVENSDKELVSGLIKGVIDFAPGNQLKLSYLDKKDEYTTGIATEEDEQRTETKDRTFTGKWLYNPSDNDLIDLSASAYFTKTELEQTRLYDLIVNPPPFFFPVLATPAGSKRTFEIETVGLDVFNTSRFGTALLNHTLTYGGDFFRDEVETVDPNSSGELFTPTGERETYGFYIQDKLEYSDWLEFIAALRYDHYKLNGNGLEVKDEKFSPKLTVGITPFNGVQFFATYAEGFRAPAISETLQSGIHPVPPTFEILPNPNLRPETAENWEAGVNLSFNKLFDERDAFRAKATIFRNNIDNYIEDRLVGFNPGLCFGAGISCGSSQYVNIDEARLEGFELEAAYDIKTMFINIAYTHVRGDDLTANIPLASVFPDKVVTTLGFRFMEDKLQVGGRWTYADGQDRVPNPTSDNIEDQPSESYNLVDLFATYKVNETVTTALTLNNIFDEQVRLYRHTEPEMGFNAKLSATIRFGN